MSADGGDRPRRRQGRADGRRDRAGGRSRSSLVGGRPLLAWQFGRLRRRGVDARDRQLRLPARTQIRDRLRRAYGDSRSTTQVEPERLGTRRRDPDSPPRGSSETFFALNGDSLRRGRSRQPARAATGRRGAEATVTAGAGLRSSRYGQVDLSRRTRSVVLGSRGRSEIDTNLINCGMYVLSSRACSSDSPRRAISTRRRVFPELCCRGIVYGLSLPGYWLDVGTPDSYLQAHHDVLERRFRTEVGDELGRDYMLVAASAEVHPDARLVPPVYVGENAADRRGSLRRQPGGRSARVPSSARARSSSRPSSGPERSSVTGRRSPARSSAKGPSSATVWRARAVGRRPGCEAGGREHRSITASGWQPTSRSRKERSSFA